MLFIVQCEISIPIFAFLHRTAVEIKINIAKVNMQMKSKTYAGDIINVAFRIYENDDIYNPEWETWGMKVNIERRISLNVINIQKVIFLRSSGLTRE